MKRKELFRMLLLQFFICYTCTILASVVFTSLSTPKITEIPVSFLWEAAIFSMCAGIPSLIYYSKEELSRKQWRIRTALHTLLIEAILMTAGRIIGMYHGTGGAIAFFVTILVVDLLVRLFIFLGDMSTTDAINRKLKERREAAEKDEP